LDTTNILSSFHSVTYNYVTTQSKSPSLEANRQEIPSPLTELDGRVSYSHHHATGPYAEPNESSSSLQIPFLYDPENYILMHSTDIGSPFPSIFSE
jgi:hypothetical protein